MYLNRHFAIRPLLPPSHRSYYSVPPWSMVHGPGCTVLQFQSGRVLLLIRDGPGSLPFALKPGSSSKWLRSTQQMQIRLPSPDRGRSYGGNLYEGEGNQGKPAVAAADLDVNGLDGRQMTAGHGQACPAQLQLQPQPGFVRHAAGRLQQPAPRGKGVSTHTSTVCTTVCGLQSRPGGYGADYHGVLPR